MNLDQYELEQERTRQVIKRIKKEHRDFKQQALNATKEDFYDMHEQIHFYEKAHYYFVSEMELRLGEGLAASDVFEKVDNILETYYTYYKNTGNLAESISSIGKFEMYLIKYFKELENSEDVDLPF